VPAASPSVSGACSLCSGPLERRYPEVRAPYSGERFSIVHCPRCDLGQTAPVPRDLSKYYPASYHGGRHGITANYCVARRARMLRKTCEDGAGKKLLDIGCGEGTFLLKARAEGWSAFGTELKPEAARSAGIEVWESLEEAAKAAPYDCVTLWHSLEHVADPVATVRLARDLMHPDGKLIIAVPDAGGLQARVFAAHWLHLDVPRHVHHFTQRSIAKLLDAAGFEATEVWHQEFEYDFLGWIQSALNKVLPEPNVLFSLLTGRRSNGTAWQKLVSVLGTALLSVPALMAVVVGTALGQGGTLVMAAHLQKSLPSNSD
jgi:2-polyprenyl-3-methyl-5-hydroxy-6-metoxy-1,4-benzoquinol methylase